MSDCRKDLLSKLMGHVRLPLASKQYILKRLEEEPLLKNSFECMFLNCLIVNYCLILSLYY